MGIDVADLVAYLELAGWRRERAALGLKRSYRPPNDDSVLIDLHVGMVTDAAFVAHAIELIAQVEQRAVDAVAVAVRMRGEPGVVEGEIDPVLRKRVKNLILYGSGFVVYLDEDDMVQWRTDRTYPGFCPDAGLILNRVAMLQAERVDELEPSVREAFRSLLGEAVARMLDERDTKYAKDALDKAEKYLGDRNAELARRWQIVPAFWITAACAVLALSVRLAQEPLIRRTSVTMVQLTMASLVGAIGAFLSMFFRINRGDGDARSGQKLARLEGLLRVIVGMLSALLAGWALSSGMILSTLATPKGLPLLAMLLVCTLAGASERFVAGLVTKLDGVALQFAGGPTASGNTALPAASTTLAPPAVPLAAPRSAPNAVSATMAGQASTTTSTTTVPDSAAAPAAGGPPGGTT